MRGSTGITGIDLGDGPVLRRPSACALTRWSALLGVFTRFRLLTVRSDSCRANTVFATCAISNGWSDTAIRLGSLLLGSCDLVKKVGLKARSEPNARGEVDSSEEPQTWMLDCSFA